MPRTKKTDDVPLPKRCDGLVQLMAARAIIKDIEKGVIDSETQGELEISISSLKEVAEKYRV